MDTNTTESAVGSADQSYTQSSSSSMLDKVTFGLLLVVVFLAPLFFVSSSFLSVQFATSLLFAFGALLSLGVYVVAAIKRGSIELPSSRMFLFGSIVTVPVVYTLSSLSHGFSRMSFLGYTFDLSTVGFVVLSFLFLFLISMET